MKDYMVRAMSKDGYVKAVAIRSTELVRRGGADSKDYADSHSGPWTGFDGSFHDGQYAEN